MLELNEVFHLSQSSKSVIIGFLSRFMQYWLKNHWPGSSCSNTKSTRDTKDSSCLHTHSIISNSAILNNNCFTAKCFVCMTQQCGVYADRASALSVADRNLRRSLLDWNGWRLSDNGWWSSISESHSPPRHYDILTRVPFFSLLVQILLLLARQCWLQCYQ